MKQSGSAPRPLQTIGKVAFAAISAVEGLRLDEASLERMREWEHAGLSFAQRRAHVLEAYASRSQRK